MDITESRYRSVEPKEDHPRATFLGILIQRPDTFCIPCETWRLLGTTDIEIGAHLRYATLLVWYSTGIPPVTALTGITVVLGIGEKKEAPSDNLSSLKQPTD